MITALQVHNFRAFEEQRVEFAPVTLFFGPNNSGKSALLSGLSVLAQTCASTDLQTPLLLTGTHEDLGTYEDMVFGNQKERQVTLRVEAVLKPAYPGKTGTRGMWWDRVERETLHVGAQVRFGYRRADRQVVLEDVLLESPVGDKLYSAHYKRGSRMPSADFLGRDLDKAEQSGLARNTRLNHFLPAVFPLLVLGKERSERERENVWRVHRIGRDLSALLESIEFIGPFRAAPKRTYPFSGESYRQVGRTGERAIDILVADAGRRRRAGARIFGSVSKWMKKCGVAAELKVQRLTDRHFEMKVSHPKTREYENLADAGYGCSQVLPVLVAGYNAEARPVPPTRVLIVQQPELHLHPRAQAELGDFFRDLARAGVQCVVETHSEHLLLRVQSHVASPRGGLSPNDVAIYYVYSARGKKRAKRLELDEEGLFTEDWPGGFFPERLAEAKRRGRAALKRRQRGARGA